MSVCRHVRWTHYVRICLLCPCICVYVFDCMCVFVSTCVCVVHTHLFRTCVCVYVYTCMSLCVCVSCTSLCVRVSCTYVHVSVYVCTLCPRMCVCVEHTYVSFVRVYMCTCTRVRLCVYVCLIRTYVCVSIRVCLASTHVCVCVVRPCRSCVYVYVCVVSDRRQRFRNVPRETSDRHFRVAEPVGGPYSAEGPKGSPHRSRLRRAVCRRDRRRAVVPLLRDIQPIKEGFPCVVSVPSVRRVPVPRGSRP